MLGFSDYKVMATLSYHSNCKEEKNFHSNNIGRNVHGKGKPRGLPFAPSSSHAKKHWEEAELDLVPIKKQGSLNHATIVDFSLAPSQSISNRA